jgi:Dolichyl-phosphate-mannose-protein mannosyltransferase
VSAHAVSLEQTRASRLRLLLARPVVAPFALGCLTLVFVALTWNTWGNPGNDTGYDTLAGIRVAHGQLPYIDFTYYYGPLAPFALGLASLVGGAGMWPAVAFGLAVAVAIVFATYALAAALSNPLGGFLAGAMTAAVAFAANTLSFVDPHTFSATLGVLLTLLFLLCVQRFATEHKTQWLIVAGAALGLVCLTRFEFALAAAAASAVWLTLRVRAGLSGRRDVGLFVLPAVVIPAAVYGAFLSAVSLHVLLFENLYPRDFLQAAGNHVLRFRTPWTISSFVSLGSKLVLYAVGVALVLFVARLLEQRRGRFHRLLVVGLGFGAVVILAAAIADP